MATEDDLFEINDHEECHCELVEGVLIEKAGTTYEALLATNIAIELLNFARDRAMPFAPDIAVEVLNDANTDKEMSEKLHDYFTAGTRLVWYVDPQNRQVQVFTSPEASRIVTQDQMLGGGEVLPGFELSLKELFAELPEE